MKHHNHFLPSGVVVFYSDKVLVIRTTSYSISFLEPALPLSSGTGTMSSGVKRFRSQDSCYEDSTAQALAPVTKWRPIFHEKAEISLEN